MNIAYYKKWVEKNVIINLNPQTVLTFEDMLIITFNKDKPVLHLYYGSGDCLVFWGDDAYSAYAKQSMFESYLHNTKLVECGLIQNDRILQLYFTKQNIYNQQEDLFLIFEMVPRYQNLILCKKTDGKLIILECMKKITFADQHIRQVLPGCEYQLPETSFVHTDQEITFPLRIGENTFENVNDYFSFLYTQVFGKKIEALKDNIRRTLGKELKKALSKLEKQRAELEVANEREHWQQCVELLKSSFHLLKPGMETVSLVNYYAQSGEDGFPTVEIRLNPALSPQKNLDHYVKRYRKAVTGQKIIAENIAKTEGAVAKLQAEIEQVEAIEDYLECRGRTCPSRNCSEGAHPCRTEKKLFRVLPISADWEILIGRSNKENDILTCKTARVDDWWFHSRIFHGTHVVLRNYRRLTPPDQLIILCSQLAAYYSSAKNSTNVPVDYTQIRYVTKPRGAAPGYVVYKNQKTYYAKPMSIREAMVELGVRNEE